MFSSIFLDNEDGTNTAPFFSLSDFQDHLQGIFEQVEGISDRLLQYASIDRLEMSLQLHYLTQSSNNTDRMVYALDPSAMTILDPFNLSDALSLKTFLAGTQAMAIEVTGLLTADQEDMRTNCREWTILLDYRLQTYANVEASLTADSRGCGEDGPESRSLFMDVLVLVLALGGILLSMSDAYSYLIERRRYVSRLPSLAESSRD